MKLVSRFRTSGFVDYALRNLNLDISLDNWQSQVEGNRFNINGSSTKIGENHISKNNRHMFYWNFFG